MIFCFYYKALSRQTPGLSVIVDLGASTEYLLEVLHDFLQASMFHLSDTPESIKTINTFQ